VSKASLVENSTTDLLTACYLAVVVSVSDPDNLSRVQVRLLSFDGAGEQDAPIWARVAVPFAGDQRGTFMIPDVADEVVVSFLNGDFRLPIVVGGLWNGSATVPETLGGDRVDRWTIVGKAGTRIAIVEANSGQPTISFSTPGGVTGKLTDEAGGKIELVASGTTITVVPSGLSVQSGANVQVQSSQVQVTAGQVSVNAAMSQFSGVVQCDTLIATTVVSSTYTPGAGNVW
jgi:uncharacterized protein involved in type VI secretion and phage assembly